MVLNDDVAKNTRSNTSMKITLICFILTGMALVSFTTPARAQVAGDDELIMRSLVLLEKEMREPGDAGVKKKAALRILEMGKPLLGGSMNPEAAEKVAAALVAGKEPPAANKGYFGFWALRAMAAVNADDEEAGVMAGQVIQALGGRTSKSDTVLNLMATLNVKGWLHSADPKDACISIPFVNSIGMKFVPVPIKGGPSNGQRVLFSIWETRRQDYAAFASENPGGDEGWKDAHENTEETNVLIPVGRENNHPVVDISHQNSIDFCTWLTKKELLAGKLKSGWRYRLPTDHEWSCAVGIGSQENAEASPKSKDRTLDYEKSSELERNLKTTGTYPWGKIWPPPVGSGNLSDMSGKSTLVTGTYRTLLAREYGREEFIDGYLDNFITTAPVGSFKSNIFGLYDLEGNVSEFCADLFDPSKPGDFVVRGGSWEDADPYVLISAHRGSWGNHGYNCFGFRCVLASPDL